MITYFTAFVIVLILIVLYKFAMWNTSTYEDYLYGFWAAEDDEFCESSDIESMMILIGESECGWTGTSRTCYIVIMDDICNQGFTLSYRPGWSGIGVGRYRINACVQFDDEQIWADRVCIDVDVRMGTMKIHGVNEKGKKIVYAKLHKQHEISNLCRDLGAAELVEK